jgi:hypothetical protein
MILFLINHQELKKPRQTFVFSATLTMDHLKIKNNAIQKDDENNQATWSPVGLKVTCTFSNNS